MQKFSLCYILGKNKFYHLIRSGFKGWVGFLLGVDEEEAGENNWDIF
jgi:hypothetical protein